MVLDGEVGAQGAAGDQGRLRRILKLLSEQPAGNTPDAELLITQTCFKHPPGGRHPPPAA